MIGRLPLTVMYTVVRQYEDESTIIRMTKFAIFGLIQPCHVVTSEQSLRDALIRHDSAGFAPGFGVRQYGSRLMARLPSKR